MIFTYIKYPIFNNKLIINLNFIKYIYILYNKNLFIFNYIYIKIIFNKKIISLISNIIILKELKLLNYINIKNLEKNKKFLSFSNKKIFKQKGLGKSRVRNKKNPIFIKGIKLFKNKNNKIFKFNKNKWIYILNYIIYNKKSFIIFLKFNIFNNIINMLNYKNILIISNIVKNNKYNILNINNINFILLLKYKFILILI